MTENFMYDESELEETEFEEPDSEERKGFGTIMGDDSPGEAKWQQIGDLTDEVVSEAEQLINSFSADAPVEVLFANKAQLDSVLTRIPEVQAEVDPLCSSKHLITKKKAKKCHNRLVETDSKLRELQKVLNAAICRGGLAKGESIIQRVKGFLDRNIEEEKKKDKGAYYDTCDNYSRLCEGLSEDLAERYKPCADDAGLSAELDRQINTLSDYSRQLNERIQ